MQRAAMRQGTAATKTKGLVRGGGKKPWKQKGTGRARAGSRRSPLWKGGGTVFGPQPRSYAYAMPRKKMRAALYAALSSKVQENRLMILSDWATLASSKTKQMAQALATLGLSGRVLIVASASEEGVYRASRNLRDVKVLAPSGLNLYDLLLSEVVLTTPAEIDAIALHWKEPNV